MEEDQAASTPQTTDRTLETASASYSLRGSSSSSAAAPTRRLLPNYIYTITDDLAARHHLPLPVLGCLLVLLTAAICFCCVRCCRQRNSASAVGVEKLGEKPEDHSDRQEQDVSVTQKPSSRYGSTATPRRARGGN